MTMQTIFIVMRTYLKNSRRHSSSLTTTIIISCLKLTQWALILRSIEPTPPMSTYDVPGFDTNVQDRLKLYNVCKDVYNI